MKKFYLLWILIISFSIIGNAQENSPTQDKVSHASRWDIQLGLGTGSSFGLMEMGLSHDLGINYNISVLQIGLSFLQTHNVIPGYILTTPITNNLSYPVKIEEVNIESIDEFSFRPESISSLSFSAGINLMRCFKANYKHNLNINAYLGLGMLRLGYALSIITQDADKKSHTISVKGASTGLFFNYGIKSNYEYLINDKIGVGATLGMNIPLLNPYLLGNIVVHL